jgi:hypothetical protein
LGQQWGNISPFQRLTTSFVVLLKISKNPWKITCLRVDAAILRASLNLHLVIRLGLGGFLWKWLYLSVFWAYCELLMGKHWLFD